MRRGIVVGANIPGSDDRRGEQSAAEAHQHLEIHLRRGLEEDRREQIEV